MKFRPNIVALVMSLTGISIILTQQISDANKFGSHKPNTFMKWLKSFPTGKTYTLQVDSATHAIASTEVHCTVSIPTDATIEGKVDFLLRQVAAHDSNIATLNDRVDAVNSLVNKTKKEFQASLDTLTTSLNTIIAGHAIGTYDLNLFGINITICGIVIQFFSS